MKWIETRVIFEADDPDTAEELIADLFYTAGLQGVAVEDPTGEAGLDWADQDVHRPDHHAVIGYFPKNPDLGPRLEKLESDLKALLRWGIKTHVKTVEMDQEDWAESWKAYFWPEKVGEAVVVKPTWRDYTAAPGEIVIEIDPGMAFGTGTHATTALCIGMLETYVKPGDRLLDVGTGSGILMVTAARLGAGALAGIDNDPVAVEVAETNLRLNRIDPDTWQVGPGDLVSAVDGPFDLVTANILSEVILTLLDSVARVIEPGGLLICSGIIEENRDRVTAKMAACGFDILEVRERESWVAIAGKKTSLAG
ncbi:MAG: 50S ribosomal protein L11 methyltransferase [Desulfobacterales bacterium]|nr:50S ribosomal protein L11 methyltransferase [Desulfobacterales bacterium]